MDHSAENTNRDRPLLGIVLMVLGMIIIPVIDVCAKILSETYPVWQVIWSRFAFHMIWLFPLLIITRQKWWLFPVSPGYQFLRGMCLLLATVCFFISIKTNPIPIALAMLFISPLVVTLLSPVLLGEMFGIRRFIATVVGFCGVLIVINPITSDFDPTILFALLAGILYALYIIITRKVSNTGSAIMTLFYTGIVGVVFLSPMMPAIWVAPDQNGFILMALIGLSAVTGHYLIIRACHYAPASIISPFNYTEIISATFLSFIFFDYLPEPRVWLGIGIICLSGLYISMRESQ